MSGSSRSSMDGWMGAVILAVIGGMIGARASGPPTSARPRSPAEVPAAVKLAGPAAAPAQQEPEPSVSVPARSWEDPLGAARAYLKAKNVEPPSQFEDDPLVRYRIVVPMDSDETADDIDSRMGMRVAISAALHRLGMAPVRSRLQLARVEARSQRQSDVVAAETWEPATTLPPTANFGGRCQVLYLPSKLLDGAGAGVVSGLDQLLVDLDLATTRCLLLRSGSTLFRDDLVEVIKRPRRTDCDVNLTIVNTSSTADLKFLFARVLAPSSGEPEMLRKTVGELAGRTDSPARYSCGDVEVRRILGSDTALLAKLAAELTLRGVNTANPQNVIAVIHDRNSDYGRALPKSFAEALGTDKSLVPIAFASPLDADPRFAPKLLLPDRGQSGQHEQQAIISAGERQVDFIHRALQDLSTDLETTDRGRLRAVFIGATDRWDVRPTVQMIKEKFPEALILMTDLYSQYADPGEYDVMRNVVIASHLDLRAHDALSRDLPPFRSCYHTAAFLAVLQGYGSLVGPDVATDRLVSVGGVASAEQKDEISAAVRGDYTPHGRVFEISRHGATNLETRNSSAPRAADAVLYPEPMVPRLVDLLSQRDGWRPLAALACFGLALLLIAAGYLSKYVARTTWLLAIGGAAAVIAASAGTGLMFEGIRLAWFAGVVFAVGMILSFLAWTWSHDEGAMLRGDQWDSVHRWGACTVGAGWLFLALFVWIVHRGAVGGSGEPFAWGNGISSWCTEFIRIAAIIVGAMFLVQICRNSPLTPRPQSGVGIWKKVSATFSIITWGPKQTQTGLVRVSRLLRSLEDKLSLACRARRIVVLAFPFGLIVFLLLITDMPKLHTIRGGTARLMDTWVMSVLAVVLNLVVFIVWDMARLYTRCAHNLAAARSSWDHDTVARRARETGFDRSLISSLLDVEFIAARTQEVNRLIYWPVLMILLCVLAIHPRFDAWPFRWNTVVLFGLSLVIAVYAGYTLRRAAEKVRDIEMERLQREVNRPDVYLDSVIDASGRCASEVQAKLSPLRPGAGPSDFELMVTIHGERVPIDCAAAERFADTLGPRGAVVPPYGGPAVDLAAVRAAAVAPAAAGALALQPTQCATIIHESVKQHRVLNDDWSKSRAEQAKRLLEIIRNMKKGAFAPWNEDPLFRAVGVPLIGFASVQLVEWINTLAGR